MAEFLLTGRVIILVGHGRGDTAAFSVNGSLKTGARN
tara:strand:+ start:1979 stop:2089 length:111 start_codon:yes stop_codon:yes gene_type:complete